jgi:hypothetical protein
MGIWNFNAVWIGILFGLLSGAGLGLKFHESEWLGGYGSWPRRMLRLGHISFFGIAIINLVFALSVRHFGVTMSSNVVSLLFVAGAVTMPTACFLSAWKKPMRHLFYIPVLCLCAGAYLFVSQGGLL